MSFAAIANDLNSAGYRTSNNLLFTKQSVQYIAQNPVYTGRLTYNKRNTRKKRTRILLQPYSEVVVDNAFPAIIDRDKFDEVQRVIASRPSVVYDTSDYIYLLTGLIRCSNCSKRLVGSSNRGGRSKTLRHYYLCPTHKLKHCNTKSLNADYIESVVIDVVVLLLNELLRTRNHDKQLRTRINETNVVLTRLKKDLVLLESKYQSCLNAITLLSSDKCLFEHTTNQMRTLLEQISDVKSKIATHTAKVELLESLKGINLSFTRERLLSNRLRARALCQVFIKEIIVNDGDDIEIITV